MGKACGIITRILLGIINVIFLMVGIALVVTSCLVKWSNIGGLKELSAATSLVAIDGVAIAFICIGAFTIFLSLIGLFGLACSNKCLLIFYEVFFLHFSNHFKRSKIIKFV